MGTFDDLIQQIDAFIRKYYKNRMLRGLLLFFSLFLATFLLVTGLEYIGHFNSFVRGFLLFSFIGLNGYVLIKYIILPTIKLFSFGKRINRNQAASIIGDFFPTVSDKLLNTLQLHETAQIAPKNLAFIQASIQQNAKHLSSFRFTSAISYAENKKFLTYFLPIFLIVIIVGVIYPSLFSVGSQRIINYNTVFVPAPSYTFSIDNDKLTAIEGEDFTLQATVIPFEGKPLPNNVYLKSNSGVFLMEKTAKNKVKYTLKNVSQDVQFQFQTSEGKSNVYTINTVKRTALGHLNATINYPDYLKMDKKSIENPGDLIVPEGTKITWDGLTKNTASLTVLLSDTSYSFNKSGFRFQQNATNSGSVLFVLKNNEIEQSDSLQYRIEVVKDEYPSISVSYKEDSIFSKRLYFKGKATDDYGLTRVDFTYIIAKENGKKSKKTIQVPGIIGASSPFSMTFNLGQLPVELNDRVSYFFTVYDNDGIHGPKATKSQVFQYASPSLEELSEQREQDQNSFQEQLKDLIKKSESIQKSLNQLKTDIANSKNLTWQQQQQIKQLQQQQQAIEEKMKSLQKKMDASFKNKEKLSPFNEELNQKKQQLQDLMDKIMDDELKKLLDKLNELLQEKQHQNLIQTLEQSKLSVEEKKNLLDHTMEMVKKMDVMERTESLQKQLQELAEKQSELKEKLKENLAKKEASKKQEELNKSFKEVRKDLEELQKKNDELKRPFEFNGLEKTYDEIENHMKKAKENIQQNNTSDAQKQQQEASEKMKEAASQLNAQMNQSQQEQQKENYEYMRALLDNLLTLSFNQEENIDNFNETDIYDPHFVELGKEQRQIIASFKPIKDSLKALADRVPEVASFIEQELSTIAQHISYIPDQIDEREKRELQKNQHFVMTGFNNLALFLNQSMSNAMQQMKGEKGGKGKCKTPGASGKNGKEGNKGTMGEMKSIKEMLQKQLEQLKKGKSPGGNQPGSQPGNSLLPMGSKSAAKMAAELNAIQQKLAELRQELNKDGSGDGNKLNKLIQQLEDQQKDLIHKQWNTELLDRQKEILTRLLESEKALRERGKEKKRESKTGKNRDFGNQIQFLEYNREKERQIELLKTLDPSFSNYYKNKSNAYFKQLN